MHLKSRKLANFETYERKSRKIGLVQVGLSRKNLNRKRYRITYSSHWNLLLSVHFENITKLLRIVVLEKMAVSVEIGQKLK